MGLFDFLKRKKRPAPDQEGPSGHYVFAHYAVRQMALTRPLMFLGVIASPDAREFLEAILKDVIEQCECPPPFAVDEIEIHTVRVGDFPCAVLHLPAPQNMAEAHMVALVVPVASDEVVDADADSVTGRYFTLEKGFRLENNEERTVLAEWDMSGHSNYGDGPPPVVEEFVRAIGGHLM